MSWRRISLSWQSASEPESARSPRTWPGRDGQTGDTDAGISDKHGTVPANGPRRSLGNDRSWSSALPTQAMTCRLSITAGSSWT